MSSSFSPRRSADFSTWDLLNCKYEKVGPKNRPWFKRHAQHVLRRKLAAELRREWRDYQEGG